jgi:predicted glycoside hydrolase/deacetylase ChbG (UPF0249 family)
VTESAGPTEGCNAVAYLVVNADDYGYFRGVSEGILDCVLCGRVTAVGMMPHRPWFESDAARLRDEVDVDVGVHLVLTEGEPLARGLAAALPEGRFPGKFALTAAILGGRLDLRLVRDEWRAQIERCLQAGLRLQFVNSHEHVHMLPPLFKLLRQLAREYGIPHIRLSAPDWPSGWPPAALVRDSGLGILAWLDRRSLDRPALPLLGMAASGRLNLWHLRRVIERLKPGTCGELMCHPGRRHPGDPVAPATLAYHDWEGETQALCDPMFSDLLKRRRVRLVGYRHLRLDGDGVVVRAEESVS